MPSAYYLSWIKQLQRSAEDVASQSVCFRRPYDAVHPPAYTDHTLESFISRGGRWKAISIHSRGTFLISSPCCC